MNDTLFTKRREARMNAPEHIQDLYGDPELGGVLGEIVENLRLSDAPRAALIHIVGDIILGFHARKDLKTLLIEQIGISAEKADNIEQKVQPFFVKMTTPINTAMPENETFEPSNIPESSDTPLTRDDVLRAVSPARTMPQDVDSLRNNPQ